MSYRPSEPCDSMMGGGGGEGPMGGPVGTIVWIRRKNGSWWPGRVLQPHELPGSRRSGTPIKLLGREDASLDWYNLEKSKRVKAFRCGEFDECIGKAMLIAGLPTKKREKYARREDAILQALELEKSIELEAKSIIRAEEEAEPLIGDRNFSNNFNGRSESLTDTSQSTLTLIDIDNNRDAPFHPLKSQKIPGTNLNGSLIEANQTKAPKSLGNIASKKKASVLDSPGEASVKVPIMPQGEARTGSCINTSVLNKIKRKRSQVGLLPDENVHKKRDRRKPLTKVLESSARLEDGGYYSGYRDSLPHCAEANERDSPLFHNRGRIFGFPAMTNPINGLDSLHSKQKFQEESLDAPPFESLDSSVFYKHLSAGVSDRRLLSFSSQIETPISGLAYVDSLLQKKFVPTTFTSMNDNGFDKSSSVSAGSSDTLATLSFENGVREGRKGKEFGTLSNVSDRTSWISQSLHHTVGILPDSAPTSSLFQNPQVMRSVDDLDTSFPLMQKSYKVETPVRLGSASIATPIGGNLERSHITEEDEAESLQISSHPRWQLQETTRISEGRNSAELNSSNRSAIKAMGVDAGMMPPTRSGGLRLTKPASEGPQFDAMRSFTSSGSSEDCCVVDRKEVLNACTDICLLRWRAKGRRTSGKIRQGPLKYIQGSSHELYEKPNVTLTMNCNRLALDAERNPLQCDEWNQKALPNFATTLKQPRVWFDVHLEVESNCQGEKVPLVSLMSRWNGKPIVGHPIEVEKLDRKYDLPSEDGNQQDPHSELSCLHTYRTKLLQPQWRRARRTERQPAPRVVGTTARANISNVLKSESKTGYKGGGSKRAKASKKGSKSGFPAQKTRTLSSIGLRPESTESVCIPKTTTAATCIPVSLVFSRIKEALYGQSRSPISDGNTVR